LLQGFRTFEDLKVKANLTKQQKIGLKHFDDIQDRMPREEVEQIAAVVCRTAIKTRSCLCIIIRCLIYMTVGCKVHGSLLGKVQCQLVMC
jgi:hypothetical protein